MGTFILFGNYSYESVRNINPKRTQEAVKLIEDAGGKLLYVYVLLGETDLLLITEFPTIQEAMKASISLSRMLGISFKTSPAIGADEFDKLIE